MKTHTEIRASVQISVQASADDASLFPEIIQKNKHLEEGSMLPAAGTRFAMFPAGKSRLSTADVLKTQKMAARIFKRLVVCWRAFQSCAGASAVKS